MSENPAKLDGFVPGVEVDGVRMNVGVGESRRKWRGCSRDRVSKVVKVEQAKKWRIA